MFPYKNGDCPPPFCKFMKKQQTKKHCTRAERTQGKENKYLKKIAQKVTLVTFPTKYLRIYHVRKTI